MNIALLQEDLVWENPPANHRLAESYFSAGSAPADLIVLPEMFSSGFTRDFTEKEPYPSLSWMKALARDRHCAVYGSVAVTDGAAAYNRGFWVNPDGSSEHYDKRHLFTYGKEHLAFQPGNTLLKTHIDNWTFRPLICYDLRFPVWSRNTRPHYDVLIYIASWPAVRREAWKALLKARAIENQCYVIGVNRVGIDGYGLEYSGDSCFIDFKGDLLLDAGDQKGRFDITLSYHELQDFRQKFPFLEDADEWEMDTSRMPG
ncbi:MAG: nitrilase family protein [Leadbetterella sp.]|nr:nitrilase family protein [Leadbetterella sp.]